MQCVQLAQLVILPTLVFGMGCAAQDAQAQHEHGHGQHASTTQPSHGQADAAHGEAAHGEESQNPHEAFEHAMHEAGEAWRQLRNTQFTEDSQPADLAAVRQLESALILAKANVEGVDMAPPAREKFGDDTEAFRTAFQLHLLDALGAAMNLERALLQNNPEAAQQAFANLREQQREGHALFRRGRDNLGAPGNNRQGETAQPGAGHH